MARNRQIALLRAAMLLAGSGSAPAANDAENGEKIFRNWAACHGVEPDKKNLESSPYGIIGRTAGTADGYNFSRAMAAYGQSGIAWAADTLDTYLQAPRKVVPGTKMSFPGLRRGQERSDVIAYLQGLNG